MRHSTLQRSLLAFAAGASLLEGASVAAESEGGPSDRLEEIVVTARKREENLQTVPAAVTALTSTQLRELQVDNTADLQRTVANTTIVDQNSIVAGTLTAFIRGIGTDPGFQQGVGIYIDDMYLQSPLGTDVEVLSNIERIEVLKGPQGNLYGRNTTGGAIKYVTRDPGDQLLASAEVRGGRFNLRHVTADLSGPLIGGTLSGDLGVLWKQRDGFQQSLYTGQTLGSIDQRAVHGVLKWTPSDSVTVKLGGTYSLDTSNPRAPTFLGALPAAAPYSALPQMTLIYDLLSANLPTTNPLLGALQAAIRPISAANTPGLNTPPVYPTLGPDQAATLLDYTNYLTEASSGFLSAQWLPGDQWSLKSISTYRVVRVKNTLDLAGLPQFYIDTFQRFHNSDFSQEFQVNYTGNHSAAVAGLYYLHGLDGIPSSDTISPRVQLTETSSEDQLESQQIVKSTAAYANLDYNLTDALSVSVGARYTHEDVGIILRDSQVNTTLPLFAIICANPALGCQVGQNIAFPLLNSPLAIATAQFIAASGALIAGQNGYALQVFPGSTTTLPTDVSPSTTFTRFTPSAKLAYDIGSKTMIYVGYAAGYKAGGFDTFRPFTQFNPEKVQSYTLGLKTTTPDSTLRFNTEAFYNDYTDKQLSTVEIINNSLGKVTKNAGQVRTYGLDADLTWLTPVRGLRAGITAGFLQTGVLHYYSTDANTGAVTDLAPVTRLGFAPRWTGAVGASYTVPFAGAGDLTFEGNIYYRSMSYTDSPIDITGGAATLEVQRANAITNAGITFRSTGDRWHVAFEGRNLSDKRVITNSFNAGVGSVVGQYNDPRTWSLSAGFNIR
jgi:iron complex outermembrane receptor protein